MSEISIKSPNPWLKSHTSSESLETKDLTPPKKKTHRAGSVTSGCHAFGLVAITGSNVNLLSRNDEAEMGPKLNWLVVWTPLKNISQLGWLFPIYGKTKNVPNHQPVNAGEEGFNSHGGTPKWMG